MRLLGQCLGIQVPVMTWTTNLDQYVFNLDGRMIRTMRIMQQIKRRGIRSQEEALGDHMLLTQQLEVIEHQRDVANIRNEILKDGVVRRKQKAGRQMQAAEMKVQTLQNELAEVKALLEEQTLHANQLQDAVQHRTQQWVQEQVCKTLRVGNLFNVQSPRLLCKQILNNRWRTRCGFGRRRRYVDCQRKSSTT
jgi:hypothetical protein